MKIVGVGLDLIAVERVERLLKRKAGHALDRLLTGAEREYCLGQAVPARHVAARLAAKEAAYKAFQAAAPARGIGWRELEVTREADGRPGLKFHGAAEKFSRELLVESVFVSISHTEDHALAIVQLATK